MPFLKVNYKPAISEDATKEIQLLKELKLNPHLGGEKAWTTYIRKEIKQNIDALASDNKSGTCVVRFIG